MQLTGARRWGRSIQFAAGLTALLIATTAHADGRFDLGATYFGESGGPLSMDVLIPSAELSVELAEPITLAAAYRADIVSGASVAVVDAPASDVDAISAASVSEMRNEFAGTLSLHDGQASVDIGYSHAFEHDYRSDAFSVGARTELFDKNTGLHATYARGWNRVCDVAGSFEPVMKLRLPDSTGCFGDPAQRSERELAVHDFQAGWTQAWTPRLTMQLTATAELLHGFQVNPYRSVRIGKTAAQEHHPNDRARYALGLGLRYWIEPLAGALQADTRVYRDTWDIASLSGELAYEQSLLGALRMRARGRYYAQTAAAFYSDDYVLAPRGRYFTGDRELSPMRSLLLGGQVVWSAVPNESGSVLGFMQDFSLLIKVDVLRTYFDDFHYDRAAVPNTLAVICALEARAVF
jgi:hypothetical protein